MAGQRLLLPEAAPPCPFLRPLSCPQSRTCARTELSASIPSSCDRTRLPWRNLVRADHPFLVSLIRHVSVHARVFSSLPSTPSGRENLLWLEPFPFSCAIVVKSSEMRSRMPFSLGPCYILEPVIEIIRLTTREVNKPHPALPLPLSIL